MKSKKKQKHRKQVEETRRNELAHLSGEQMGQYVEELLARGKARDALHALQQKHLADNPGYAQLKMRALALRANQLEEKGLHKEASVMLDTLSVQLSLTQPETCEHLGRILALAPLPFALGQMNGHRNHHLTCPVVERAVGYRMVLSNQWDELSELPDEHPLKQDGGIMARVMPDLLEGRWQAGVAGLEALSRRSPFAAWKLFAKAMLSAHHGKDEDLQRALRQLPEDFPFPKTLEILRKSGSAGLEQMRDSFRRPVDALAHEMVDAIHAQSRQLPGLITRFARQMFPAAPSLAERSLSEIAGFALMKREVLPEKLKKLLVPEFAEPVMSRLRLFASISDRYDTSPFCIAPQYMQCYKAEAPYLGKKPEAEAAVYFLCLSTALGTESRSRIPQGKEASCLKEWLEVSDLQGYDLYAAAADRITVLAPNVQVYYKIAAKLDIRQLSASGKRILEEIMFRMQKQFQEDPFPYIHLSRLHRSRGAYRKSQKILEEAWKLAPYDTLVRENYGIGLLKAAIMSRNRKALEIARKDLQQAVDLNIKALLPLTNAIGASIEHAQYGSPGGNGTAIEHLKEADDPVVRYRSLICYWQDMDQALEARRREALRKDVNKMLQKDLEHLQDEQILQITSPMPEGFEYLIGTFDPVAFFGDIWSRILPKLNERHVLGLYNLLLSESDEILPVKWVLKDLKARLKQQKNHLPFKFYSALANYLLNTDTGSMHFSQLLRTVGKEDVQKLKELARSIARHFKEPLSEALASFRFEVLDSFPWGFPSFDFDEDEDEDEWEYDEEDEGDMDPFGLAIPASVMEELVAGIGQISSNKQLLKIFFEMLIEQVEQSSADDEELRMVGRILAQRDRRMVETLRKIFSGKAANKLGRVGRLLLYPDE